MCSLSAWYSRSVSTNDCDTVNSGTSLWLSTKVTLPSSWVSTMKSGVICCTECPIVSPIDVPGLGLSLRNSRINASACNSVMRRAERNCFQCFFVKRSKYCSIAFCISSFSRDGSRRSICNNRHSCSERAPMPAGSNCCNCNSTCSISAEETSRLW